MAQIELTEKEAGMILQLLQSVVPEGNARAKANYWLSVSSIVDKLEAPFAKAKAKPKPKAKGKKSKKAR